MDFALQDNHSTFFGVRGRRRGYYYLWLVTGGKRNEKKKQKGVNYDYL
jgi:hypothetical protein